MWFSSGLDQQKKIIFFFSTFNMIKLNPTFNTIHPVRLNNDKLERSNSLPSIDHRGIKDSWVKREGLYWRIHPYPDTYVI